MAHEVSKKMDFTALENAADVAKYFADQNLPLDQAHEVLGDGFDPIDDKRKLVGVDMVLLQWTFSSSDKYNGEFVTVRAMTADNRKIRFTDGSTGIAAQLRDLTTAREKAGHPYPNGGLICPGLRVSDYTYTNEKGQKSAASTYYIAA